MRFQPGRIIALCALMPWLSLSHTTASAQTITLPASSATLYNNAATEAWAWKPPTTGYCGVFYCNGQDNTNSWAVVSLPSIEASSLAVSADAQGALIKLNPTATQPVGSETAYLAAQVKIPVSAALQPFTQYRISVNLTVDSNTPMTMRVGLGQKTGVTPNVTASTFLINDTTHCTRPTSSTRVCSFNAVYTGAQASPGNSILWIVPSTFGFSAKITGIKIDRINSDPLRHHRTNLNAATSVATRLTASSFGFTINKWDSIRSDWPDSLGAGLLRIWNNGTYWAQLEPTQGIWNSKALERLDNFVSMARLRTPKADVVITLGLTPPWATSNCTLADGYNDEPGAPPACSSPPTTTAQRDAWKNYVRTIATRYLKDGVRYFELWNEPDIMFSGSHQDLVNLAADTKATLESVSPGYFKLIAPSTTANGTELLDGFLAKGGGKHVDIIGYHSYYSASDVERKISADTANVYFRLAHHKVANKPIWNTEGAPECTENTSLNCLSADISPTVAAQRSLHIRTMAAHLANGVSNFSYYHLEGASNDPDMRRWLALSFKMDGSPQLLSPLGSGFSRAVNWMLDKGATDAWSQPSTPIRVMRLGTTSATEAGALVWNTSATAQTVQIPAESWGLFSSTCTTNWLGITTCKSALDKSSRALFADGRSVSLNTLPYSSSNKTVQLVVPAFSMVRIIR